MLFDVRELQPRTYLLILFARQASNRGHSEWATHFDSQSNHTWLKCGYNSVRFVGYLYNVVSEFQFCVVPIYIPTIPNHIPISMYTCMWHNPNKIDIQLIIKPLINQKQIKYSKLWIHESKNHTRKSHTAPGSNWFQLKEHLS